MPAPSGRYQCAVVGTLLYMTGGIQGVNVLDTASGTWSTLEPGAPCPQFVHADRGEVLCEYKERPGVQYTSGEV